MPEGDRDQQQAPAAGRVWLLAEDPHDRELVFSYGFDEELNAAVKRLPRRWFDWRRKHWRVPADPRIAEGRSRRCSPASPSCSRRPRCWPG